MVELSWSIFSALYDGLVLACIKEQFSGDYNVLLTIVCYNIERLCVHMHSIYRHVYISVLINISYINTHGLASLYVEIHFVCKKLY